MNDKTWTALAELGYCIVEDTGRTGMLRRKWRHSHPNDNEWSDNGMSREACRDTLDEARQACLDHLRANKEAMMSKLLHACYGGWDVGFGAGGDGSFFAHRPIDEHDTMAIGHGDSFHDAVFALWCKVKGVPE